MQEVPIDPHQRKAVDELANGKILCGGVGTGKSRVAIRYFIEKESDRNVIVITTAKKRDSFDWEAEAAAQGIGREESLPVGGKPRGTIIVDSWNNLWKYTEVTDAFFIFDEQRLVGGGTWVRSFYKIARANHWILLSATPGDTWLDYIPVFVANGLYKNKTEFLREHVVYAHYSKFPKVDRYIAVGRLVRHRNHLLVDMPYHRHTVRHIQEVLVEYDKTLFERCVKDRWNPFKMEPMKDVAELFRVMRRIANSDMSRVLAVQKLMTVHPRLIVFYNFDYELEILRQSFGNPSLKNGKTTITSKNMRESGEDQESTIQESGTTTAQPLSETPKQSLQSVSIAESNDRSLIAKNTSINSENKTNSSVLVETHTDLTAPYTVAEWNGYKHQPVPEGDRWLYLVQYAAGAEGWNCIETDAVIFWSLTYSYRQFEQCQGRIDRLNTPFVDLWYYVLKSKSIIDIMIWRALSKKQNFNESRNSGMLGVKSSEALS